MDNEQKQILLNKLQKLQPSQFDEVVFKLTIKTGHFTTNATQTQKAIELILLIEQQTLGIERLNEVLNSDPIDTDPRRKPNIVVVPILMMAMIAVIGFLWNNNNNQCVNPPCTTTNTEPTMTTGGSSSSPTSTPTPTRTTESPSSFPINTPTPTPNTGSPSSSPKYLSCRLSYDPIGKYCHTRQGDDCSSCPPLTP